MIFQTTGGRDVDLEVDPPTSHGWRTIPRGLLAELDVLTDRVARGKLERRDPAVTAAGAERVTIRGGAPGWAIDVELADGTTLRVRPMSSERPTRPAD